MKKLVTILSLLLLILIKSTALAQNVDSADAKNYVQPFSAEKSFRTWSFGVNAGLLTTYTLFESKYPDFTTRHELAGYGFYVKKQILPAFALQADFMQGKLRGAAPSRNSDGTGPDGFDTKLNLSGSLSGVITLANINWRHNQAFMQPFASLGAGFLLYRPTIHNADGTSVTFRPTYANNYTEKYFTLGAGLKFNVSSVVNFDIGYRAYLVNADNVDARDFGNSNDKFSYCYAGLEFVIGKRSKPQMANYNPVASMRHEYLMRERLLQKEVDRAKDNDQNLLSSLNLMNNKINGLEDSDNDGVADRYDKCPNTPPGTVVSGAGCPLPKMEDTRLVKDAISDLEFELGKTKILASSYAGLDKVADLLITKNFTLKLAGHTDNTGSDKFNMKLSKGRAESVKAYLVSKGVNPSRVEATGYGEEQPVATNKTEYGRRQNRRVEFTLY